MKHYYLAVATIVTAFLYVSCDKDNNSQDPSKGGQETEVVSAKFLSAVGEFQGESNGTAVYVLDLSTNEYSYNGEADKWPVTHLYVALGGPSGVDLTKLTLPEGEYTAGDADAPEAGKFFPGIFDESGKAAYNSYVAVQQEKNGEIGVDLIKDGKLSVVSTGALGKYNISGELVYEDGTKLTIDFEGYILVENGSSEVPPSDELPLPETSLTENLELNIVEAYYYNYGTTRYVDKKRTELYLQLYADNNYANCLDLFLLIDSDKYTGDKVLPVGKYPLYPWYQYIVPELSGVAGYHVKSDNVPDVWLGCNYTSDYTSKSAIVSGEIEVVSCDENMNAEIKFTLYDNAATPHSVTGSFKGKLQ